MEASFSEAERGCQGAKPALRRRAERRALDSLLASEDLVSMRKDGAPRQAGAANDAMRILSPKIQARLRPPKL